MRRKSEIEIMFLNKRARGIIAGSPTREEAQRRLEQYHLTKDLDTQTQIEFCRLPHEIPIAHANAAEVLAGRTTARGYELKDKNGKKTDDPGKACRMFALDRAGKVLKVFNLRPETPLVKVTKNRIIHESAGIKTTFTNQDILTAPIGGQLVMF